LTANRFVKKLLKITGVLLGVLLVLLVGFHFWFQAHAKQIIQDMVTSQSNGKVKLKIGKLRFSYFSKKIEMEKVVFYNTDTLTGSTATRFSVDKMKLQAKAILPIVFKKRILIDSLTLLSPHIQVTRIRATDTVSKKNRKDISIPEEIGKVYSSIQDALQVLNVKRFQIDDGTFTLINKIIPDQLPMTITNLHFHIDNLKVDDTKLTGNEKLLFSDNIVLRSDNQNIIFPDGRHRLSFSQFRINLQKRLVEFDSCTIAATRADSSSAAFSVFFDALLLTNIDFDTLYKSEVIKADSVYCVNPKFNLDVQLGKKKGVNKPAPKLGDIIKQLTGDLQLGYVVVSNADFNIKTIKDGNPSSFTFSNNNFEMQGLSIDQDAAKPLKVKNFAMAIRNYENFIKDSTYSIKFDSVLFKGDQITLSNFLFNKFENGKISNTFSIPQFSLQGLSWDELVFEKRLKADQAIMFSPYISYTVSTNAKKKADKQNIFQSLGTINDYMDLQYLDIKNGTIDLKLKNNLRVQLENADVAVQSNSLLTSTKLSGIKNSLTNLSFRNGKILAGNLTMELKDIRYVGKSGQFGAGSISITDKEKKMVIDLQEIAVEKMQVNEITGSVFADGVQWQKGNVVIHSGAGKKEGTDAATIELKNVRGTNTTINAIIAGKSISTNLASVFFNELIKKPDSKLLLDGLDIIGKQLQVKDNNLNLSVAEYDITDNKSSSFRQILYKSNNGKMTADISIPSLSLIPHVQPLLNGDIALDAINMVKPVINLHLAAKNTNNENNKTGLPKIDISELKLTQPTINFTQASDSGILSLSWQGQKNSANFLQGSNLHTNAGITSVSNLNFYLTDFIFTNPKGKTFTTGDGKVAAQLKNIGLEQKENEPLEWKAIVADFDTKDFRLDSIGKTKGNLVLNSGSLNNLNVSSSTITNLQKLAAVNTAFRLKQFTGNYVDATKNLQWYNAGFNRNSNIFSLDSFSFTPALEKDSFIAKQLFQTDYISFKADAVNIGPVDIDTYIRDNTLSIGTATINNLFFTDYKDKQMPFNAGIIKPLPVDMIKRIPQHLTIDTVLLTNANVEYTEVNEKIKKPGTITVNRMTVRLINFKNYNIKPTDSLSLQANGYLMDTAWIRLRVKESYTDSLGGFLMTVRMKPADLTILNPALIPLASVKIESGFLDTLSMRAVGREYLSLGEMRMNYHDLKIRLLKNGDTTAARNFLSRVINTVVKNKNTSRMGQVFFIRKRDRSAINYLIKIALSGMSSSVGAKSNKKMIRKYKKELEQRKLPPIDLE
jgi:hypothetical protein